MSLACDAGLRRLLTEQQRIFPIFKIFFFSPVQSDWWGCIAGHCDSDSPLRSSALRRPGRGVARLALAGRLGLAGPDISPRGLALTKLVCHRAA